MSVINYLDPQTNEYVEIPTGGTDLSVVSDKFSEDKSYNAGDYCIYNDTLYKFTGAKSFGAWNAGVVERTNVGNEIKNNRRKIYSKQFSGVTDVNGNISLNLSINEYVILGVNPSCFSWRLAQADGVHYLVALSNSSINNPVKEELVSGIIYYININD